MVSREDMEVFANRIPQSEVDYVKKYSSLPEIEIRVSVFLTRRNGNICNNCGERKKEIIICPNCQCTPYCSEQCFALDLSKHRIWCCNIDSSRDMGHNTLMLVDLNSQTLDKTGVKFLDPYKFKKNK